MKETYEIPIHVLVPPDGLSQEEEDAWLEQQKAVEPSLKITVASA